MSSDSGGEELVTMSEVPPHLQEARVREVFVSTTESEPKRVQGMSWTWTLIGPRSALAAENESAAVK